MNTHHTFTVRDAVAEELEIITEFQLAMALETENVILERSIAKQGVSAVFSDPAKGKYYVVASGNDIIASMLTTPEWSDWRNRNILWIQSVYVMPPYRMKGAFKTLYRHIENIVIKDSNIGGLRLYVDKSNLSAQVVYSRLGMNGEHYKVFEWMK
jgi:hypothetical protein